MNSITTLSYELQSIEFLMNQMPGYFILKNLDSMYLKGCSKFAGLLSLKHGNDLCGLTDYSVKHEIAQYGDLFVGQDKRLKEDGKAINGYYAIHYNGLLRPCVFNKYFLEDPSQKIIVAHCLEITDKKLAESISNLMKFDPTNKEYWGKKNISNYFSESKYDGIHLSKRQSQCLFYLLRGKSASAIGKILGLSTRTIESYIEIIKDKMLCNSKAELIDIALKKGYFEIIPPGIMEDMGPDFLSL